MPNPGRMGIGVVLTGPTGTESHVAQPLEGTGCNNEAELRALHAGLTLALQHSAAQLRIYTDSHWLLEQLAPKTSQSLPARPTVRLQHWLEPVRSLLQGLEQVQWRWIPRHHNTEADALARQACLALMEDEK